MDSYGFIKDKLDLKFLLLNILNSVTEPLSQSDLLEIALCDNGVNYFDLSECLKDLEQTGHAAAEDDKYLITSKGRDTAGIIVKSLPSSVVRAAQKSAIRVVNRIKREAGISVSRSTRPDGFVSLELSLCDNGEVLFRTEFLAANNSQADLLENNFRKNATDFYNTALDALLNGSSDKK